MYIFDVIIVFVFYCSKPQEGLQQMFEKSLEDFYCICDQLEINLVSLPLKATKEQTTKFRPAKLKKNVSSKLYG